MQFFPALRRVGLALALLNGFCSFVTAQPIALVQKPLWPGFRRGSATGVAVSGQYAFLGASQGGLMVLDVSNPARPRYVTQLTSVSWPTHVRLSGHYAYLGSLGAIYVVDIAEPTAPVLLSSMNYGRSLDVDVV